MRNPVILPVLKPSSYRHPPESCPRHHLDSRENRNQGKITTNGEGKRKRQKGGQGARSDRVAMREGHRNLNPNPSCPRDFRTVVKAWVSYNAKDTKEINFPKGTIILSSPPCEAHEITLTSFSSRTQFLICTN